VCAREHTGCAYVYRGDLVVFALSKNGVIRSSKLWICGAAPVADDILGKLGILLVKHCASERLLSGGGDFNPGNIRARNGIDPVR